MIGTLLSSLPTEVHDHEGLGFWAEVWAVTTDPAHIIAELIFTIIFDGLFVAFLYGVVFRKFILPKLRRDIHKDIDEAHGESHDWDEKNPIK